jgi:hypothetical protein
MYAEQKAGFVSFVLQSLFKGEDMGSYSPVTPLDYRPQCLVAGPTTCV